MEINPKYQIGNIVYFKYRGQEGSRLFITEIITRTCISGTQIFYAGKVVADELKRTIFVLKGTEINEIELGELVPEQSKE